MDWVPDLRQLRAFVAVAEEGSFTLAARRIFVTQSAVSHSLRSLEEQLSCKLLDRSGKRVLVTSEGELLLKRSKRVIFELEQAGRDLDGLRRWGQTRIRIGAPHTLCHFLIPSVLREFRDCFPRCEPVIEAYTGASREVLRNSLGGRFMTGMESVDGSSFHVFHGDSVNRPTVEKASWVLGGLRTIGALPDITCGSLSRIYREDVFHAASRCLVPA